MLSLSLIYILFYLLLFSAVIVFLTKADELPLILVGFFYMTGLHRYNLLMSGKVQFVRVNYSMDIFTMTEEKALLALNLFLLGTILFFIAYRILRPVSQPEYFVDTSDTLKQFLLQKEKFIIFLFAFFLVFSTISSSLISGSLALGNSYFYLFKLAIGGLILLFYLLYEQISWNESTGKKLLYLTLIIYSAVISYDPYLRFQFLSWVIAIGVLVTRRFTIKQKVISFIVGGLATIILFGIAGIERQKDISNLSFNERVKGAWDRTVIAEDANMLDGFMMVLDVYPEYLPYSKGMEHIEILLRPIPRKLWPDKPVGGYVNKLGLQDINKGTVGISQTIYGSFYGEGGVWGIILFCFIYGWLFNKLIGMGGRYNSDMYWIIRGMILAGLVPILRGGDLPGVVAFIGMSYWPVFVIMWQYSRYLKENQMIS